MNDGPKTAQDSAKQVQECPTRTQDSLRSPQDSPRQGCTAVIVFIAVLFVVPASIVGVEIKSRNNHSCHASFARDPA